MVLLTREQLEERLVALHQASLELVGELSLDSVLEQIVHRAREQASARYAALGVLDESGKLVQFIPVGVSTEERENIINPPHGLGLLGAILAEKETIRTADIASDIRSIGFPPYHPEMKTFLGVPILVGDRVLGSIYLTDKQNAPEFTDDDAIVIETLAAYAGVAIQNARLYEKQLQRDIELKQRSEDLALINDIARTLSSLQDIDEILAHTLDRLMEYLGVEASEIFLTEDDGQSLRLALHRGESADAFWTSDRFPIGEGLVGITAETGHVLLSECLGEDGDLLRPAVAEAGFQCLASVPMSVFGKVVGVMTVATRNDCQMNERETQLLSAIGTWAAIAIENARLNHQARRLAVLEERERIGMDLHDGIIQSIYAVGLGLDYARMAINDDPELSRAKIEQAIEGLDATIRDLRTYILDLRPRQFRGENLMDGLRRLIEEFRTNGLQNVTLLGPEEGLPDLPITHATALFHITQEALANSAKHARAQQTSVQVWTAPGRALVEISDNGQGFDLHKMSVTIGHGLSNIHTRAHKVGGDVEITSEPGAGTTVLAWVPLNQIHDLSDKPQQSQN